MTTVSGNTKTESNIFRQCMKLPFKILLKLRNLYLRSLSGCTGQISYGVYGSDVGYPPHLPNTCPDSLQKSYSANSTNSSYGDDDFRHLIRASSANSTIGAAKRIESDIFRQQPPAAVEEQSIRGGGGGGVRGGVGRSRSVNGMPKIGRIDEEEPSEFGDEINLRMEIFYNPRRRRNNSVMIRRSPLGITDHEKTPSS